LSAIGGGGAAGAAGAGAGVAGLGLAGAARGSGGGVLEALLTLGGGGGSPGTSPGASALVEPPQAGQGGDGHQPGHTQAHQGLLAHVVVFRHSVFGGHSCLLAAACLRAEAQRIAFILGAFHGNLRALFRVFSKISLDSLPLPFWAFHSHHSIFH
jgi:hypothetical protein